MPSLEHPSLRGRHPRRSSHEHVCPSPEGSGEGTKARPQALCRLRLTAAFQRPLSRSFGRGARVLTADRGGVRARLGTSLLRLGAARGGQPRRELLHFLVFRQLEGRQLLRRNGGVEHELLVAHSGN